MKAGSLASHDTVAGRPGESASGVEGVATQRSPNCGRWFEASTLIRRYVRPRGQSTIREGEVRRHGYVECGSQAGIYVRYILTPLLRLIEGALSGWFVIDPSE